MPIIQVFLSGMVLIFLGTFLLFDASELDFSQPNTFDAVPEERRALFGALCALLALTQQVLIDLADPVSGMYTFRLALDKRVAFLGRITSSLDSKPADYVPNSVRGFSACHDTLSSSFPPATGPHLAGPGPALGPYSAERRPRQWISLRELL